MATKKTTKKTTAKKKAEPKAPSVPSLTVSPRSVPTNHPVAVSWTDVDQINVGGAEGAVGIGAVAPGGSGTWSAAHAGDYTFTALKEGKEVGKADVRVR